jgi:hypothetical protein
MQERAAGSPPITAWVLLFLGIVGIVLGLIQAPGILEIGGTNETTGGEPAEEAAATESPAGTAEASVADVGAPSSPGASPSAPIAG